MSKLIYLSLLVIFLFFPQLSIGGPQNRTIGADGSVSPQSETLTLRERTSPWAVSPYTATPCVTTPGVVGLTCQEGDGRALYHTVEDIVISALTGTVDNFDSLSTFQKGRLYCARPTSGHTITTRDASVSGGNLRLVNQESYVMDDPLDRICFRAFDDGLSEVSRHLHAHSGISATIPFRIQGSVSNTYCDIYEGTGGMVFECTCAGSPCAPSLDIPLALDYSITANGTPLISISELNGVISLFNDARARRQECWNPNELIIDGVLCTLDAQLQIGASGPYLRPITCNDDNGSEIHYSMTMRNTGWDASTISWSIRLNHPVAEAITFAGNFSAQCIRDGQIPMDTWGTPVSISTLLAVADRDETFITADHTPLAVVGNCLVNDHIYWRFVLDAAASSTNVNATRITEICMSYPVDRLN